jgi:PAS domain-containing protein
MADVLCGKIPGVRDAEVHIERPDGSRIIVMVDIAPQMDEHGEITGAINCFYDVTARKRAEEVGRRLVSIVEASDDAIITKDLDGIVKSWNQGAQRLYGYTPEESPVHQRMNCKAPICEKERVQAALALPAGQWRLAVLGYRRRIRSAPPTASTAAKMRNGRNTSPRKTTNAGLAQRGHQGDRRHRPGPDGDAVTGGG